MALVAGLAAALLAGTVATGPAQVRGKPLMLSAPLTFAELPGWAGDDHRAALAAFLRHCRERRAELPAELSRLCGLAHAASESHELLAARTFLEQHFEPRRILSDGFVTGYFEPEYEGSRQLGGGYDTPLLARPPELVPLAGRPAPAGLPKDAPFAFLNGNGQLIAPPDRGAIMDGALAGRRLELVWLADPVDAFYVHVQGSARIRLREGGSLRVGYAGKTGHPYSAIGRVMIERGLAEPGTVTMQVLRKWLAENPHEIDGVLRRNRSYIFFREVTEAAEHEGPVGAAGLPLLPGRSLAIDAAHHAYGTLVFVSTDLPSGPGGARETFRRLMIADDTGSAIVGPARGDIFFGSGEEAGERAGRIQHRADMVLLVPRGPGARP